MRTNSFKWISTLNVSSIRPTTQTYTFKGDPSIVSERVVFCLSHSGIWSFFVRFWLLFACLNPISGRCDGWNWQFQIYLNCNRVTRYGEPEQGKRNRNNIFERWNEDNAATTCRCQENKWNIQLCAILCCCCCCHFLLFIFFACAVAFFQLPVDFRLGFIYAERFQLPI